MRLLNVNMTPLVKVRRTDPRVSLYEVRGRHFAYDVNSMAVVQLDHPDQLGEITARQHAPFINACYNPNVPAPQRREKALSLVLHTTQTCNLNCGYCFLEHEYVDGLLDTRKGRMGFEVAKRAIDELLDWSQAPHLGFFGGEPTLNWDLMVQATEYFIGQCRERGFEPGALSVTTNATRLDADRIRWLADRGFSMIVSLDGTKASQDANRPQAMPPIMAVQGHKPKGTYDLVLEKLRLIREVAPALSRRVTLRGTFPWHGRAVRLVDDLHALTELVDEGLASWASLEPAILTESCAVGSDSDLIRFQPERVFELTEEYLEKADYVVSRFREGKRAYHHQIVKFVERMLWGLHAWTECGAGVGYMSVDAQGAIYACHRQQHSYIGNLDEGVNEILREKWVDNRTVDRPGCSVCNLQFVCGGGCREESIGHFVSHEGMTPAEAIRQSYTTMCNFKDLWFRCALWVMSEVPRNILVHAVPNPRAKLLGEIQEEHRRRQMLHITAPPSNRLPQGVVRRKCVGCDAC